MEVTAEKWEQVRALFDVALCQEPAYRPAVLARCPEPEIRILVEKLLASYDEAGSFLSTPFLKTDRSFLTLPKEAFVPGDLIASRFRIIRLIAKGGMGEVYEAEDGELQQRIAIKTIRPEVFEHAGILEQFKREVSLARMVSHPNVCRIYEMLRDENSNATGSGTLFLTMELLQGETLKSRLQREEKIAAAQAIPLLLQIAKGLAAAHNLGILHRDLKPGNVMLVEGSKREELRPVITDFGLAIHTSEFNSAHRNHLRGTPAYMSPEQLEGRSLSPASDIYALGLIAYEMLTGIHPLAGSGPLTMAAKRLTQIPLPLSGRMAGVPRFLKRAVYKCLQHRPADRFATADEFMRAIGQTPTQYAVKVWHKPSILWISSLIAISAIAAFPLKSLLLPSSPVVLRYRQLTDTGINKGGPLQTDGSKVYFYEYLPERPAFAAVPVSGGEITHLSSFPLDEEESLNGNKLVYLGSDSRELYVSNPDKSNAQKIFAVTSGWLHWPRWSPDGKVLRFGLVKAGFGTAFDDSIWEVKPDGSHPHPLIPDWRGITNADYGNWTPDGKYYIFDSVQDGKSEIWAVSQKTSFLLNHRSSPQRIVNAPIEFSFPLPSTDGKTLFAVGRRRFGELVRYDMKTNSFAPYLGGISAGSVSFSRDGIWVAYVKDPEGTLWRSKADGSEKLQLTFPPFTADSPHWSPDGKEVAVRLVNPTVPDEPNKIHLISRDGGTPVALLPEDTKIEGVPTWSADGTSLLFGGLQNEPNRFPLRIVDIKTKRISEVPHSLGMWTPRWSPDGRYIVALSIDSQSLMLFDVRTQEWRPLLEHIPDLNEPCWSHDGRFVYVDTAGSKPAVYRSRISGGNTELLVSLAQSRRSYGQSFGVWFGLTPQDEILLLEDISEPEIYALDMNW
jgi:serine/threonine protein kinase